MSSDWHTGPSIADIAKADVETHVADTGRQLPQPTVDRAVSLLTSWYRDARKHGIELRALHAMTSLAGNAVEAVVYTDGRNA